MHLVSYMAFPFWAKASSISAPNDTDSTGPTPYSGIVSLPFETSSGLFAVAAVVSRPFSVLDEQLISKEKEIQTSIVNIQPEKIFISEFKILVLEGVNINRLDKYHR